MLAFQIISTVALYATAILAAPGSSSGSACGGTLSDNEVAAAEAHFSALANTTALSTDSERVTLTIPVYWHVIRKGSSTSDGHVTISQIGNQIAVLNAAYKPAGLYFKLYGSDYKTSRPWFENFGPTSGLNSIVKTALHKGTKRTLNIYSTGFASAATRGLLGYSTWPWDVSAATLVHQVGHWLGLYHTFQGGCVGSGDAVSDTPAEAIPAYGCPTGRNTCPAQAGLDPIHNYMDTSFDSCRYQLSKGQIKRLRIMIAGYR